MNIIDLLDAGQSILGAVSDAVETGDYSNLAGDIQDIAFGEQSGNSRAGAYSGQNNASARGSQANAGASGRGQANTGTANRGQANSTYQRQAGQGAQPRQAAQPRRSFFMGRQPDKRRAMIRHLGGLAGAVCFLGATVLSLLFFAAAGMVGLSPSPLGLLILAFFASMTVACFIVSRKGRKERKLIERFYTYAGIIGTREYFSIAEVASASGQKPEQVQKDVKQLKEEGIIPYAVMDRSNTTVMLSDRMVQEYEKAEKARLEREEEDRLRRQMEEQRQKEEEQAARAAKKKGKGASDAEEEKESELDAVLREGSEAIRTIREINDRIPDDYEMSNKLYRLENIMKRIFERIRRDPARAKDIRRLMNYYLPTTIKLLHAYEELYAQSSGGENVQESKRQIEDAMDTINDAFETLLDDLFRDQAWDIASDIDVMKTMMAQDGLVSDKPKEKQPVS